MATVEELEQRVAALERELAELKRLLPSATLPASKGVGRGSGIMADIPEEDWQKFLRLCREARESVHDPYEPG